MNFVKLDPLLHSRPKMVAVGWWGRQLFIHLVMLSGKYDLRGRFAPHYANPDWLVAEWQQPGYNLRDQVAESLRDLESKGVLVRDGDDLVIEKWDEFYSGRDFSTPRVKAHRARLAEVGTPAAPAEKDETLQDNTKQDETTPTVPGSWGPVQLAAMWNEMVGMDLPRVTKVAGDRERQARARCAEFNATQVQMALQKLLRIPGLLGRAPSNPTHKGWKADFDWFVTPLAIAKILEGKYDQWGTGPAAKEPSPLIKDPTKLYE